MEITATSELWKHDGRSVSWLVEQLLFSFSSRLSVRSFIELVNSGQCFKWADFFISLQMKWVFFSRSTSTSASARWKNKSFPTVRRPVDEYWLCFRVAWRHQLLLCPDFKSHEIESVSHTMSLRCCQCGLAGPVWLSYEASVCSSAKRTNERANKWSPKNFNCNSYRNTRNTGSLFERTSERTNKPVSWIRSARRLGWPFKQMLIIVVHLDWHMTTTIFQFASTYLEVNETISRIFHLLAIHPFLCPSVIGDLASLTHEARRGKAKQGGLTKSSDMRYLLPVISKINNNNNKMHIRRRRRCCRAQRWFQLQAS